MNASPYAPPTPEPVAPKKPVPVLAALLVAGRGLALATRVWLVEAYKIPSGSMRPTLVVGDHTFVTKTPWSPRRGRVIVFPFPEHPEQDFVKRVIGLPGDRLSFTNG